MSTPRYLRRSWPTMAWGVVIALCIAGALVLAGMLTVRGVERRTRLTVTADLQRTGDSLLRHARADIIALSQRVDSLRAVAAHRDTVWLHARTAARREATAPMPSATDTTALVAAVQQCRATLMSAVTACDSAQAAHAAVIDAQTARAARDSAALAALTVVTAGISRSRDAALTQLARTHHQRRLERSVCAVSVATNLIQWRLSR